MKNNFKIYAAVLLAPVLVATSCKKKDSGDDPAPFITEIKADLSKDKVIPIDTVYFSAVTSIPSEIEWDFDDGSASASGETVMHVYGQQGYYTVVARATANDKTTSSSVDVNTSKYVRFQFLSLTVLGMPALNPEGSPWDNDGISNGNPDLYVFPDMENFTSYNSQISLNVPPGPVMNVDLDFAVGPIFSDMGSDFKVSLNDDDNTDDENIAVLNFGPLKNILNANPNSPQTSKTISANGVTARLNLLWIQ